MEVLALKIIYTTLVICFVFMGVMKFIEFDDLPYWVSISIVFAFLGSLTTLIIATMVFIWS